MKERLCVMLMCGCVCVHFFFLTFFPFLFCYDYLFLCTCQDGSKFEGVFKSGRREGRGTYHFANGAVYEGRFRDDQIDGMGTFNMPGAVFMPKNPPAEEDSDDAAEEDNEKDSKEKKEMAKEIDLQKSPEDIWIVPIHLAQDIGTIHFLAGFNKEGM